MREIDVPLLDLVQQTFRIEVRDHLPPRRGDGQVLVGTGAGVQRTIGAKDVDHRQAAAESHFVVVGIVSGRDLDAAAAQFGLGPFVGHERYFAAQQGKPEQPTVARHVAQQFEPGQCLLAALSHVIQLLLDGVFLLGGRGLEFQPQLGLPLVKCRRRVRMHGHGRIAEHGFGAGRGDGHRERFARSGVDHRIAKVPEVSANGLLKHFIVADGRLQEGVPVDEPLAAVDSFLAKQIEKGRPHGPRANVVERKACSLPIATAPHLLQLVDDPRFVFVFPLPDPVDKCFATQVVAGLVFL